MAGKKKGGTTTSGGSKRGGGSDDDSANGRRPGARGLHIVGSTWDEEPLPDPEYLDEELPFSAALITPPEPKVIAQFFCPACGKKLLGPEGFQVCPHLLFAMESGEGRVLHFDPRLKDLVSYLRQDPDDMEDDPIDVMYDLVESKFKDQYSMIHIEIEGFKMHDVEGEVVLDLLLDLAADL